MAKTKDESKTTRTPSRRPAAPGEESPTRFRGVTVAWFKGFAEDRSPLLEMVGTRPGVLLPARTTAALSDELVGRQVAVMFEEGDPDRPVIMGVIEAPPRTFVTEAEEAMPIPLTVNVDKKRIVLRASEEIVLECGGSRIVLDKTGKIVIHGDRLLSRARSVNRIKGGSVQIN